METTILRTMQRLYPPFPVVPLRFFLQMPLHADLDVWVSRQGVQVLHREALVKTMKVLYNRSLKNQMALTP